MTLNHRQGPKDNFCMRQTREWWWITTRFSCWSVIIIMYATVIKWLHIWNCSWPRFTWPAFGHGNPEIGFFIYLYRMICNYLFLFCIGIVSVDENSSLEHSLSPSRSKFSSTGGDLGDELTPLHQAGHWVSWQLSCDFDFHGKVSVDVIVTKWKEISRT